MNPVDLKTFNNSGFKTHGSKIKMALWFVVNAFFFLNPLSAYSPLKVFWLRLFGAKVGKNVVIKPNVNIKYAWNLTIGDNAWIGEKVWIDNLVPVHIGANACVSQGAMLLTGNHDYKKSNFDLITGEITLEDGVWIGAQSVVCPGIKCASHSVLSVNSVATKNLEAYTIYQGNPALAVRVRQISD